MYDFGQVSSYSNTTSDAINLIEDNFDTKRQQDTKNEAILALSQEGFDTLTPEGPRYLSATLYQKIMWRLMRKLQLHDFELHGNEVPEWKETIMTFGLATLAEKAGYAPLLRAKQGVRWNFLMFGDAFHLLSTQENDAIPMAFGIIPNSNVYVDQFATQVRTTKGRSATQMLVILSMSKYQAWSLWPALRRNKVMGQIPRDLNAQANVETGRGYLQTGKIGKDLVEVGYYFDIRDVKKPTMCIIAGAECYEIDKAKGHEYPFWMNNEPYIPVGQNMCMPSASGFYNHGVGDLFFRFAIASRKLLNLAYGHAEESTYPTTFINIAQGKSSEFFNALQEADAGKARGMKSYVPLEYDERNPNANRIAAQTITTNSSFGEFQVMYDLIYREIRQLGITLDDQDVNPNATQYQILAEEEKSTAWVKGVQEYNADQAKFDLDLMLDLSKKFIKTSNDTPIDVPVMVKMEEIDVKKPSFTLGAWADELRKNHYFVKVDSGSGAVPSNVVKQTRLNRIIPLLQPGSPAYDSAVKDLAALNDRDVDTSSLQPKAPAPATENAQQIPGKQVNLQDFAKQLTQPLQ